MQADAAGPGEVFVPDMPRRTTMNAILLGSIGVSVLGLAVPYLAFSYPLVAEVVVEEPSPRMLWEMM